MLANSTRMSDVAARLADEGRTALPIVDVDDRVIGVIDARALERAVERGEEGVALGAGRRSRAPASTRRSR
jgi:CBS domain-containing protein